MPSIPPGRQRHHRGQWQSGAYKWAYQYYAGTSNGAILEVTYSTNVAPTAASMLRHDIACQNGVSCRRQNGRRSW